MADKDLRRAQRSDDPAQLIASLRRNGELNGAQLTLLDYLGAPVGVDVERGKKWGCAEDPCLGHIIDAIVALDDIRLVDRVGGAVMEAIVDQLLLDDRSMDAATFSYQTPHIQSTVLRAANLLEDFDLKSLIKKKAIEWILEHGKSERRASETGSIS